MKKFKKGLVLRYSKGFTLIELLVVVAIIGLLTVIVLVSLTNSKNKGADAAVKSNLATTRTSIEMFFLDNGSTYLPAGDTPNSGSCPLVYNESGANMFSRNKDIVNSIAEAVKRGGNGSACYNSTNAWAVAVGLKSDATFSWCIDSEGASRKVTTAGAINGTTCN